MLRKILSGGLFLLLARLPAAGDELHLRDGRVIVGIVSETDGEYLVERGENSRIRFPRSEVEAVERKPTREERYENLLAITDANDAEAWLKLARWCRENRLSKQAKAAYQRAMEIAPENLEARRGAGYIRQGEQWLSYAEMQTALGKVRYRGKWRDADEAAILQDREQRRSTRAQNRAELQKIMQIANRLQPDDDTANLSRQLAALDGDGVWKMLEHAANSPSLKVRETAYGALALRPDAQNAEKLELLAKRLRYEDSPRLVKILTAQLRAYSPREYVPNAVLNVTLSSPVKNVRERTWGILAATGDLRLIDKLIAKVDFCPVEKAKNETDGEALSKGWSSSEQTSAANFYPAHEALVYLTGQNFKFNDREKWQAWWSENRDKFALNPNG